MKIHNFRAGFATNSSSSHSIILLPPHAIGSVSSREPNNDGDYGWDWFRLTTEEEKLRYLAAQLFLNYWDNTEARKDLLDRIGEKIPGFVEAYGDQILSATGAQWENDLPTVDHQSVLRFPHKYTPEFADSAIRFFQSPAVIVLGGNDNDGDEDKLPAGEKLNLFPMESSEVVLTRQDGPFWTIFSQHTGNKMRLSIDDPHLSADSYTKASTPELVDLKITDWCDRGCAFCYQSSTTKGVHAPMERIEAIIKMLAELNVFEVAIGGGEPTSHPQFAEILRMICAAGMVPNFTTYSDRWLVGDDLVAAVVETVGGIGVSCLSAKDLDLVRKIHERLTKVWQKNDNYSTRMPKIMAQHVVGSVPLDVTAEFVKESCEQYHPVLLLGYKEVGFGAKYNRHDDANADLYLKIAVGEAQQNQWVSLSIDTALVSRYPKLPEILGAPEALVSSPEGKFSCYVDAVDGLIAPSSYVAKADMLPMVDNTDDFRRVFATF